MIVGVPKETFPGERRVALIPAIIPSLTKEGFEVRIEASAGAQAGYPDSAYQEKGAQVVSSRAEVWDTADIVLQVRSFGANPENGRQDLDRMRAGQILIGFTDPLAAPQTVQELSTRRVTAFSMELMPRTTRAQMMDALSSMNTMAGYKAVLLAANELPKLFPMLMTAAGTIPPARVFIVGAGVTGLQAISVARRLGAAVEAYDVRPAVKEQVQSLGAKFVDLPLETTDAEDKGGYAKAQDESFYQRQRDVMKRTVAGSDAVITTAVIPGKRAPILLTADMVGAMAPGSVIVDAAAERGGNCELTKPDETVVQNGVTILGPSNLPAMVPYHASQLYAKNIVTFLLHLAKKGEVHINSDDEITRETLMTRDGEVLHPKIREVLGLGTPVSSHDKTP